MKRKRTHKPVDPLGEMISALSDAAFDAMSNATELLLGRVFPQPIKPGTAFIHSASSSPNTRGRTGRPTNPLPSPATTPQRTLYDILQISPHADPETVTAAYRSLAKRFHPDVYKGKYGDERMKGITMAYQILSDPERRKKYDRMIKIRKVNQ